MFDVVVAASHPLEREILRPFSSADLAKGILRVTEKRGVATAIFRREQGKSAGSRLKQFVNHTKRAPLTAAVMEIAEGLAWQRLNFISIPLLL
jgi:hypothetical protein